MPKTRGDSTSEPTLQHVLNQIEENRKFMQAEFAKLHYEIGSLTKRIDVVEVKQGEFEETLTYNGNEILDLKKKLDELTKTQKQEEYSLRQQMTSLQDAKNLKTLRISGIPKSHNEDLQYLITQLASKMECTIQKTDIDTIYRVKPKTENDTNTPIIIRFTSMNSRDSFYDARKTLGKNDTTAKNIIPSLSTDNKIFLNEYLSRSTQSLFYEARKRRAELGYRYIWTFHNQIYVRKTKTDDTIKICSQDDINKLQ